MKIRHTPSFWVTAALVTGAALLVATEAWAQAGAGAAFEGRPSMAGAQAGQGAMAGPPQGGIGLQGSEGTKLLQLRRPDIAQPGRDMPQGTPAEPPPSLALASTEKLNAGMAAGEVDPIARDRDRGIAKKQRSPSDKVRRAAKRTAEGAKYGVSPIDTR